MSKSKMDALILFEQHNDETDEYEHVYPHHKFRWTEDMDAKLVEGHFQFSEDPKCYDKIAQYIGMGVTKTQCYVRWPQINPEFDNRTVGDWSPTEMIRLQMLVEQEVDNPTGKKKNGVGSINWTEVSKEMNRKYVDCKSKWKTIQIAQSKQPANGNPMYFVMNNGSPLTEAAMEAHLAAQFVPPKVPKEYVIKSIKERIATRDEMRIDEKFKWSKEMDDRMIEGHTRFSADPKCFDRIAEHVGGGVTKLQCYVRWPQINPQFEGRKTGEWSPEEIATLQSLVSTEMATPTGKRKRGVGTINWTQLSADMNRRYVDCKSKWKTLCAQSMKKGQYLPSEDETILLRVELWGDRGNGMWCSIGKELNRSDESIALRYKYLTKPRKETTISTSTNNTNSENSTSGVSVSGKGKKRKNKERHEEDSEKEVEVEEVEEDERFGDSDSGVEDEEEEEVEQGGASVTGEKKKKNVDIVKGNRRGLKGYV